MTKEMKDFFCTAVSDKDFIYGVFSNNGFISLSEEYLAESVLGFGGMSELSEEQLEQHEENGDVLE